MPVWNINAMRDNRYFHQMAELKSLYRKSWYFHPNDKLFRSSRLFFYWDALFQYQVRIDWALEWVGRHLITLVGLNSRKNRSSVEAKIEKVYTHSIFTLSLFLPLRFSIFLSFPIYLHTSIRYLTFPLDRYPSSSPSKTLLNRLRAHSRWKEKSSRFPRTTFLFRLLFASFIFPLYTNTHPPTCLVFISLSYFLSFSLFREFTRVFAHQTFLIPRPRATEETW